MRTRTLIVWATGALVLAGCMPAPPIATNAGAETPGAASAPPSYDALELGTPLILDRTDLRLGTTVQFRRLPTIVELHDLEQLPALARVVITLDAWPADYGAIEPLQQSPESTDLVVVLPGYPPSDAAAEAWNYLRRPLRIVVVVTEPPATARSIDQLNAIRGLERVIAQMDEPSRRGFERIQRPFSFRKLIR